MRVADERLGTGIGIRNQANKIFPDHWSFMLGEIALYNFIILILTGVYLSLFFRASDSDVIYRGSYVPLKGVKVSEAYSSVLHISFDVRGGLLIRQIHHWAALLFVAAIVVHMCRIFFTGAFRKPREANWLIGTTLLILAIAEGFAGYSLPDDLLSGTGLRIAYSILESIPVVGTYLVVFLFGGQYPGNGDIFTRLYIFHVLLIPGLLLALISAHLLIVWRQKHTQFPQPGYTERNVVGSRLYPTYSAKSIGLLFAVFAVLAYLAAFAQVNPIYLYGPYDPEKVSAGSQPDWYMFWLEGSLRLMPRLSSHFLGHTIDWNVFVPAVALPLGIFAAMYAYPFVERWFTGDHESHELLDYPRNRPVRTGVGAATITFYLVLTAAGANDLIPFTFGFDMMQFTWLCRILLLVGPPAVFVATWLWCRRRQTTRRWEPLQPRPEDPVLLHDNGYVVPGEPVPGGRTGPSPRSVPVGREVARASAPPPR
jgi:ubiquinol-cytochrome c reductase cytochrome b subunit